MDNFVVSARKYRPDSFETVVGQPSITRTLKNAVQSRQLAHAYLFCGPRGVGKTTCARIFAKTINCSEPGPGGEACGMCESCKSFQDNRSFNIHELDAASNNSVEDIKTLIDKVMIPPQVGNYSTYIIDEVHMLSQQAFNAFLKTLEEPPSYAVFILATTEKHKIIPTILSRCQIYDFKRITVRETMNHLSLVAEKEGVKIDDTSLNIIAQKADGSMRDALSIFDQVVSFSGKEVDYRAIIENLNVLDYEYYFNITKAFLEGDYKAALKIFDEILENGFDERNFLNGIGKHFRNLLMSKDKETIKLMELSGEVAEQYYQYSDKCSVEFLFKALNIIGSADVNYKLAKDPRLHIEISLMKICSLAGKGFDSGSVSAKPAAKPAERPAEKQEVKQEVKPEDKPKDRPEVKPEVMPEVEPEVPAEVPIELKPGTAADENSGRADETRQERKVNRPAGAIKTGPRIKDYINGNFNGKEDVKEDLVKETEEIEILELNQENLDKLWLSYADNIRIDEPRLFNTLTTQKPELVDNNTIRINLNNPLQEKALNSIHNEMLAHIRKNTGREDVKLESSVAERDTEKRLYTPEEKFKHLQEQNPQLGLFKSRFNLDFD